MEKKSYQVYTDSSDPEDIWKSLPNPRLVLSIIGDSNAFVPRVWSQPVFKTGIIDTAKRAGGCWILYSGFAFGLGGLVGETIRDYNTHFSVDDNLNCEKSAEKDGMHLVAVTPYNILYQPDEDIDVEKQLILDQNGHHYIFTKHDSTDKKQISSRYRTTLVEIEKYINSKQVPFFKTDKGEVFEMRVPVVIVVVEGDMNTIEHVCMAVEQDLPVLIIEGSGKAADLLVQCVIKSESLDMKGPTLFGIYLDSAGYRRLEEMIENIREKRWLINVFKIQDDPLKMSDIVADSVLRAWAMEYVQGITTREEDNPTEPTPEPLEEAKFPLSTDSLKTKTALRKLSIPSPSPLSPSKLHFAVSAFLYPSRPPSASPITEVKSPSFSSELRFHPTSPLHFHLVYQLLQETGRLQSPNAEKLLFEAIKEGRGDFVQILLQQGVPFRENRFVDLYTETIKCKKHKDKLINCHDIHGILMDISSATRRLFPEVKIKRKSKKSLSTTEAAKTIIQHLLKFSPGVKQIPRYSRRQSVSTQERSLTTDLLLWAVLANNKEMAEIFWQKSSNPILTALISSTVLELLAKRAERIKEDIVAQQFEDHSRIFQEKATVLLDKLFDQDDDTAMDILTTNVTVWNIETNPMEFAYQYNRMTFLAHRCCQITLDKKWYAGIAGNVRSFIKIRCAGQDEDSDGAKEKAKYFLSAPITKFFTNYVIFFGFLVAFSVYLINGVASETYRSLILEYLITVWVIGDALEEIICEIYRETTNGSKSRHTFFFHFRRWIYDFWNAMDLSFFLIYITAFIAKRIERTAPYRITRRLYTLALFIVYMRFLYALLMGKKLGPIIIMIKQMLKDLLRFLLILAIFIAAVGVAYHVNRFPNHRHDFFGEDMKQWTIWQVVSLPFWQLYGETFIEELEADDFGNCGNITGTDNMYDCPRYDWIVMLISALYMLFSNLLLVNVVIAMFSYRFGIVQTNSKRLWKYYRYSIVTEYETKIPSPINLFVRPVLCVMSLVQKCRNCKDTEEYKELKEREENIKRWQSVNAASVCYSRQVSSSSSF